MKKDFGSAALSTSTGLKLVPDTNIGVDTAAFVQLDPGFASLVNLKHITTPFRTQPLDSSANRFIKRTVDLSVSIVVILALLSWLIPIFAIIIKLTSRGPVLFLQKRNKRNGELFTCIKFRSMIVNPDADILPAEENDRRITRIGKFLRNHYLDELPQFFNVLWGDMSVIGPRPHMVSDNISYDRQIKNYAYRHKVKPGITGLAQVLGFVGPVDDLQKLEARVNIDIFYVRHWSSKLDRVIFFRTMKKIIRG
ncbi:MAG TPA: sugar transferase [Ferruginibacter sp.]|nr:sugar transferase [Ferruginibacter sp.]